MRKILIFGVLAGVASGAYAYAPLDSAYNSLAARENVSTTHVKYSGSFSPGMPGFMYMRMNGTGWTEGERLKVDGMSQDEADKVLKVFDDSSPVTGHISTRQNHRACFDEKEKTGYAAKYDQEKKQLYFLKADVEDEICIPYDWDERNYYYGASPKSINWPAALTRLYTEVKYNSPFYDKIASRLDSVYYAGLEELRDADNYEAYRILQKTVAACEDGHTFIYASYGLFEMPGSSPFTTILLGDKLYVRTVESEELEKDGMKRGMEIVAVNGMSPQEYASLELRPYVCSSTPQWTDHEMFDLYNFSKGRNGAPLNLSLSQDGGKTVIDVEHKINGAEWQPEKAIRPKKDFRIADGNVAVLTLPDFQSSVVTEFFDSIYPMILQSDALVIDLRGNGGGNSGYADYILRHLSAEDINTNQWRTPIYMPAFASWGRPREWYEAPSEKMSPIDDTEPYLGPVAVITDRATFSAAEDFCAVFRGMNRGVIVGTPTGGSTGNGVRVVLTKGISANICSKHDRMADGTEFVGIGIIPDIIMEETPESYFTAGRDDVLEKAISSLMNKK